MDTSQEGAWARGRSGDTTRVVTRSTRIQDVAFRSLLSDRTPPRIHWSALDGIEFAGTGVAARIEGDGTDRFADVRTAADALFADVDHNGPPATRPRLFGGFAFDSERTIDDAWTAFPDASFVLPQVQVTRTDDGTWLSVTDCGPDIDPSAVKNRLHDVEGDLEDLPRMRPSNGAPGVAKTAIRPPQDAWTEMVRSAIDRIESGTLQKVVLATAMDVDLNAPIDVPAVLERLRRTYPHCFRFLVQPSPDGAFFGPSPERLLRKRGELVETEALAGSVPRGETPEADDELARELFADEKLQHEQGLVVAAILDALEPLGAVTAGEQTVRKLANIQHLHTPIELETRDDEHILDVVETLHPTPAVGGVPRESSMQTIRAVEPFDRGWYAAPVGWFDAAGDGEFAVGIRSGVAADQSVRLFAGGGIVSDSDPASEWDEVQHKYRPILDELR